MNNLQEMKKKDPEFKAYCEDTLTITREFFNRKLAKILGIDSNSHFMEIIEAGEFMNKLWHCFKEDLDND